MTQDEVELIYDYLHENYEYRDGELIRIKSNRTKKIGAILGCFSFSDPIRRPKICTSITVNGKRFSAKVPFLIYLYHFRKYPIGIHFKDGNVTNNDINNLIEANSITIRCNRIHRKPYTIVKNGFSTSLKFNYKFYHLGVFISEEYSKEAHELGKKELFQNNNLTAKELRQIISLKMDDNCTSDHKIKSNIKGYFKIGNKYHASVSINNKRKHLGSFNTPEQAHAAYLKAKEEYAKDAQTISA